MLIILSMNKYEKIRLVGRGAHGTVFLCNRLSDNKRVILKEIPVDQMSVDERQTSINEAKVLSMLDHPNIVGYYESFLEEKTMTIVMEYVQGGTLFDFLKQRDETFLTEKEVLHYFGQMVYTLQYVHSKLILHRDLKSQNILLNSNKSVVKIGDFGISKVLTSKSKAYTVVGTPYYISPELCEGKSYNQKSDIWALGCILYELMTLKRPFDATTIPALVMKIMKGNYDPVPATFSSELKKLLMNMLHLDPDQRPTTAQIMCEPFLINVFFGLYVDIGSIPCINRNKRISKSSASHGISSDNSENIKVKASSKQSEEKFNVWYCHNTSIEATQLPPSPKGIIKAVALGKNQKIGLTGSGLLISWQASSPYIAVHDECCNEEIIETPTYVPNIVDERFAVNIDSVVSGDDFTICRSDNGIVFSFGLASSGCLGHVSSKDITEPKIIEALFNYNIVSIASGPKHVLAVSHEHEVFSWGYDTHGCLGLQISGIQILPQKVNIMYEDKLPEKVFCGPDCSFIICTDKSLLACGSNRHNRLALDSGEGHQIEDSNVFTLVSSEPFLNSKIKSVCAGKSHTIILCENNEIYSVGSNQFFQLGWGKIGVSHGMPGKIEKLIGMEISQISCSDYFSFALTNDNSLYCWGKCPKSFNTKEEICLVECPTQFKARSVLHVSCDSKTCLILTKEIHAL